LSFIDDEYTVSFIADHFTMIVFVDGVEALDGDDPHDVAIDLAQALIKDHYNFDLKPVTIDVTVL
jgi:hypothetical protein